MQHSQESLRHLARHYAINPKTVAKGRKRASVADLPTGPKEPKSTVLSAEEEAIIVAFRRHTLLPVDDCLYALQATIPTLTRSSLHRCLQRHGIAAPPGTWEELAADAKIIKDKGIVQYPIVWSWSQAEAVICDYVTIAAAYGGTFYQDGKPSFDKGGSLEALKYRVQALKDGVSNPNSKEYLEEDVRKVFSDGDAAFALNWTYIYAKAQDPAESKVVGKIGVVPAPGVAGKSAASAVNGSMGLGVTAGSAKPDLAWKYIAFITSQPVQNAYAKLSLPIWKSSYTDAAVTGGQEELVKAADTAIGLMTPRPMVGSYQELSSLLQAQIQNALAGKATPEDALAEAARAAARIR